MGKRTYMVSTENDFGLQFSCAKPIDEYSEQDAAELFVDLNHADLDYPAEREVFVRDPDGHVTEWVVTVEAVPLFHAARKPAREST